MKKYDELWVEINNLLAVMEDLGVLRLVKEHYAKFNNNSPPEVLKRRMDALQRRLEEDEPIGLD